MIHGTKSAQVSQKQDERNIYSIMKTSCPPGYHNNGFAATHTLGHMMYSVNHVPKCVSCHKAIVVITGRAHCFHGIHFELRFFDSIQKFGPSGIRTHDLMLTVYTH